MGAEFETTSGDPDLQVDPQALKMMAQGLTETLAELKKLGIVETADVGRGFSNIELSGMTLGHAALTAALKTFGDRWEWGVRSLVADGNEFAQRLGLAAGTFHEDDQYVQGTFKNLVTAAMGNPDASDEDVSKESWSQVWGDNPISQAEHADYSVKSFEQANAEDKKVWSAEAKDWLKSNPMAVAMRGLSDHTPEIDPKWAQMYDGLPEQTQHGAH
ncbi:hypothetical protein ABZ746_26140 [Streptomyces sp. NPDC020096]